MKRLVFIPLVLFVLSCDDRIVGGTTPPTVSISSPVSGQTVNEMVTITVTTQDNEGISKVEFFIDDSLVLTDSELSHIDSLREEFKISDDHAQAIIEIISEHKES